MLKENRVLVFYDGDCGFCNWIVSFIFKAEKGDRIHFSALQSPFAEQFFLQFEKEKLDFNTFYFYDGQKLYKRSTGALKLLRFLKWPYRMLQIFWIIPAFARDYIYDIFANRRQRIMRGHCMLPTPGQKKRFIDSVI